MAKKDLSHSPDMILDQASVTTKAVEIFFKSNYFCTTNIIWLCGNSSKADLWGVNLYIGHYYPFKQFCEYLHSFPGLLRQLTESYIVFSRIRQVGKIMKILDTELFAKAPLQQRLAKWESLQLGLFQRPPSQCQQHYLFLWAAGVMAQARS